MAEGTKDRPGKTHYLYGLIKKKETGWVNISDWTNIQININHGLGLNLRQLVVRFFVSTDGTENNSFEVGMAGLSNLGFTVYQTDTNNIQIQTGSAGLTYLDGSGLSQTIDTENWYYNIIVYGIKPKIV